MPEIEHVLQPGSLYACIRFALKSYSELPERLQQVKSAVPGDIVTGPPILVHHYISSEREGSLVELGFPVSHEFLKEDVITRLLQGVECLSVNCTGPVEELRSAYTALFTYAGEHGIISDEYGIEILHDINDLSACNIEVRLVVHPWENLFRENLERTLGRDESARIFESWNTLSSGSSLEERFQAVKKAVTLLDETEDEFVKYDCISSCAHVFPRDQIKKLSDVFSASRSLGRTILESVDRVLDFMAGDPGWGEPSFREGNVIYASKGPRDVKAFNEARTREQRAEAACFCPIIRKNLKDGMPESFCYCGAGWYRQQWEGATGLPVRVEILESLLSGGDECRFAVHLPVEAD